MRRIAAVAVGALMLMGMQSAFGVGARDPKDTPGGLDIASSSIRTVQIADGGRRIRFAVSTYRAFDLSDGTSSFYWQIDSYGDGAVDYAVYMFDDPEAVPDAPGFCLVKSRNPDVIYKAYVHVAVHDSRIVCGLPRHDLTMTKSVRWRVAGRAGDLIDRAPNSGWNG